MITHRTETTTTDHGDRLAIEGLTLNGEPYALTVMTAKGGWLGLNFDRGTHAPDVTAFGYVPDFAIMIRDGQVSFSRTAFRPKHDHNDLQRLYILTQGNGAKKLVWSDDPPGHRENRERLGVEFGPVKVEW